MSKFYRKYIFGGVMLAAIMVLTGCGDNTATTGPSTNSSTSASAATNTVSPTTVAVSTTSSATTSAATSVPASTTSAASATAKPATTTSAAVASGTTSSSGGNIQAGLQVFTQNCQSCHAQGGKAAGTGPKLAGNREATNANQVTRVVRNGNREGMPAFPPSQISDTDLSNIIAYLKSIQ